MQNEIACKSYQEGRNETHTNQSETRQDCIHSYSRKFRVTIHSYYSTEGIMTALAKHQRGCCRDKNYAGSINFNNIIKFLEEQEEIVMDSIEEWEKIMNEV
jgi:hypothetical protein